ncbi:MAG TPA: hypothetical protein VJM11_16520 [Nevskiaceae bacterium]|nr:hypothetical protein [Nevskiaceae bacterium]
MRKRIAFAAVSLSCLLAGCPPQTVETQQAAMTPAEADKAAAGTTAGCAPVAGSFPPPEKLADWANGAKLFDNLGTFHRKVTTSSPEAQKWFDQGMRLVWGFNHDESTRAFVKAGTLDPGCASCWWGAALTMGPNYNVPMLPDRAKAAYDAIGRAKAAAPKATPVEQALIAALDKRFAGPEPLDPVAMQPYLQAFSKAMGEVAAQYPDDLDVQVMYAETLMNLNPWKLWSLDGKAAPGTDVIVGKLESVLAKDPKHPGANHYYIHAVEASPEPGKAVASADRLPSLMSGAGHMVHMPAHIYQRVGRYAEAEAANASGVAADLAYMKQVTPQGYYGIYLAHNYDFQAFSASMEGRSKSALEAQKQTGGAMPAAVLDGIPGMDFFAAKLPFVQVRFGRWDDILAATPPDEKYAVWTGIHRFAHAYALAAKGQLETAEAELKAFDDYTARLPADLAAGYNSAKDVLGVGSLLVAARIAQGKGDKAKAVALLTDAVAREDKLSYDEPADWFFPVRHLLGAALLDAGKAKQAEAVYREDLKRNPSNGWALFGLSQALKAQKKSTKDVDAQFQTAWKNADVTLTASAF